MFQMDPSRLSESRIELHWASQLLSAAADAKLEKAADDSHSNLGWDARASSLVGRGGARINVPEFKVIAPSDEQYSLTGRTLEAARLWLSEQLASDLKFRDYDMPQHGVSTGTVFDPVPEHLAEIGRWLTFGQQSMNHLGSSRIWPHHFDMGFLIEIEGPSRSIGGGMSMGDHHFDLPYFYVNPYGVQQPESRPGLPAPGFWSDKWFGAILTTDNVVGSSDPDATTQEFLDTAVSICRRMF